MLLFNLASAYYRVNQNWLIGRIVRDHESWISKLEPLGGSGIWIAIFEAMPRATHGRRPLSLPYDAWDFLAVVMLLQLGIAAVPTIQTQGREWGILAITGLGTLLAITMGSLPPEEWMG